MDARSTVTAKEGDRYPLRPPSLKPHRLDTSLFEALGPATVASPLRSSVTGYSGPGG